MTVLPDLSTIEQASEVVYRAMTPTPQYAWPLLAERAGCDVWVKHENHTPIGAFKVRGGLTFVDYLKHTNPSARGVIAATRGNHGQSIAFAARRFDLASAVVVPHGNSREKNAAMGAFGAELIVFGQDFQEALEHTQELAAERGFHIVPPFTPDLIKGVSTYPLEFFRAVPDVDAVIVPIGMGSGICSVINVRDALGLRTEIIGVVSAALPAYQFSFDRGEPVSTPAAQTIADGLACRVPEPKAVEIIAKGAERVVTVTEAEIRAAMRHYFTDTHNVAEGAAAAPLAALLKEKERWRGKRVGLVLSGGNIDRDVFAEVLAEGH
jgi:threonine dehydratase